SKVASAKIGMPAAESGPMNDAKTPVMESGKGPSSLRHTHPPSVLAPEGTWAEGHTIESSSGVRVIELKVAGRSAHSGITADPSNRQMENGPGMKLNRR